jgi:site-specific recombinase XerD
VKNHESDRAVVLGQPCGPLSFHIPGFAASLASQGYSKSSIAYRFWLVRAFDGWMQQRRMALDYFSEERIEQFLRYRWRRYSQQPTDRPTLLSLLRQLWETEAIERPVTPPEISPLGNLQIDFAQYLTEQRGLRPATVKQYLFHSRRFLTERFKNGVLALGQLNTQDISRCVLHQARAVSPNAAQHMTVALRNLFRFLRQRGDIATNLADAVPATASWSLAGLPKSLSPRQIERVLRACKQDSPVALRDRAVLLMLARLGLRAGEVVHMTLDDIDWEAGELTVRGKGGRQDKLPLPKDVGQSLAQYLRRARPRCACRRVFIRCNAPHRGLAGSSTIVGIVRTALQRAGMNEVAGGAHLLRHGLATAMLRKGASLPEIGEILRHQLPKTTAIYTKVHMDALRTLAQPWPGGEA